MRWQICLASFAIAACVWAEEKPATARQSLEDPVRWLEGEEAVVRETLQKIGGELDMMRSNSATEQDTETRSRDLKKTQTLNDLRAINQIRLNEVMEQLRQKRKEQLQQAFGEECTLTIADNEAIRIPGVSLVNVLNVAGRQMLQFRSNSDGTLWTVDPQRIVTAQVTR